MAARLEIRSAFGGKETTPDEVDCVVDAFEMDHALRLNFPEEGGVTRFKMLFRRFMCEANDDVDEGKKSEKYN